MNPVIKVIGFWITINIEKVIGNVLIQKDVE